MERQAQALGFDVKFWGVRGTIACPGRDFVQFGGNTSCVEVVAGDQTIVLDMGTGSRSLGKSLLMRGVNDITILLSHTHWDHIVGFPYFPPAFCSKRRIRIMAGHLRGRQGVQDVLASQMMQPFHPVPIEIMTASLDFFDFPAGDSFPLGADVDVRTAPLNHPDGATGYRITHQGRSVCYVTDTEHTPGDLDDTIVDLIAGADLVIYDSTYTDAEYPAKVGWGHSTWQEGLRLCRAAGARRLAIFHHDPDHDDERMEAIEAEASAMWSGAIVAREHMRIDLLGDVIHPPQRKAICV